VEVAYSIEGVPIRLTTERWFHIVENHDDLASHYDNVLSAVENPDLVLSEVRAEVNIWPWYIVNYRRRTDSSLRPILLQG
jgi:hypothetical protein